MDTVLLSWGIQNAWGRKTSHHTSSLLLIRALNFLFEHLLYAAPILLVPALHVHAIFSATYKLSVGQICILVSWQYFLLYGKQLG